MLRGSWTRRTSRSRGTSDLHEDARGGMTTAPLSERSGDEGRRTDMKRSVILTKMIQDDTEEMYRAIMTRDIVK